MINHHKPSAREINMIPQEVNYAFATPPECNKSSQKRKLTALIGIAAASFSLTGCGNGSESPATTSVETASSLQNSNPRSREEKMLNTDPQEDWVIIQDRRNYDPVEGVDPEIPSIAKKCDNGNLVYLSRSPSGDSIAVSSDDIQCKTSHRPTDKPWG